MLPSSPMPTTSFPSSRRPTTPTAATRASKCPGGRSNALRLRGLSSESRPPSPRKGPGNLLPRCCVGVSGSASSFDIVVHWVEMQAKGPLARRSNFCPRCGFRARRAGSTGPSDARTHSCSNRPQVCFGACGLRRFDGFDEHQTPCGIRMVSTATTADVSTLVAVMLCRLSTIQDSDRIVVIKSGKVTEAGTHQQLVAQAGGLHSAREIRSDKLKLVRRHGVGPRHCCYEYAPRRSQVLMQCWCGDKWRTRAADPSPASRAWPLLISDVFFC